MYASSSNKFREMKEAVDEALLALGSHSSRAGLLTVRAMLKAEEDDLAKEFSRLIELYAKMY
jgi:hypothetical protein